MKDYEFLEPAQIELEEEVKYYNEQQAGLGYDFAKQVADTIARILRYLKPGQSFPKELAGAEQRSFHTVSFIRPWATRS
jgi:hypothetical protein